MDRITLNGAQQSLTEAGFRFTAAPIQPEMDPNCAECWWFNRVYPWESPYQWNSRQRAEEQAHQHYQNEVAQYVLRERGLRQLLADRDARLKQLERRSRRYAQVFNILETLNKRLERIERHLGIFSTQPRMISPLIIDVDLDGAVSPVTVADQEN